MPGIIRALIALVVLAFIAKTIERKRHSTASPEAPQWPAWNQGRESAGSTGEEAASAPKVAEPASESAADSKSWADPDNGDCPPGFPVKVKLSSGIYHVEGMMNWERLQADRCYVSAEAAEADGYRASKM